MRIICLQKQWRRTLGILTSRLINIHTGESASLGDWYNNVKVKASHVELKNDFTGETMILKDVEKLSWV